MRNLIKDLKRYPERCAESRLERALESRLKSRSKRRLLGHLANSLTNSLLLSCLIKRKQSALFLMALAALNEGCSINFEVTSQKTALENQVMGTYKKLDDDLILYSSVRGTSMEPPSLSPEERKVLLARQTQIFNQDDIDEFKRSELVGESQDGLLVILPGSVPANKPERFNRNLVEKIITEENENRQVIWMYTIRQSRVLSNKDLGNVRSNYAKLVVARSPSGSWFQDENGAWQKKVARDHQ